MDIETVATLRTGTYATLLLEHDFSISGYAAEDPDEPQFIRLDTYVYNEEAASLDTIMMRLYEHDIIAVQLLDGPVQFPLPDGTVVEMPASLWGSMEE